jgi:hypothetical protein
MLYSNELTMASTQQNSVKPTLNKLLEDNDSDVRYFAQQALSVCK